MHIQRIQATVKFLRNKKELQYHLSSNLYLVLQTFTPIYMQRTTYGMYFIMIIYASEESRELWIQIRTTRPSPAITKELLDRIAYKDPQRTLKGVAMLLSNLLGRLRNDV
jgi:hypothetical protein